MREQLLGYLTINVTSGLSAIVVMVVGVWLLDLVTPGWEWRDTFSKAGITNDGLVLAFLLLGLALVVAAAAS